MLKICAGSTAVLAGMAMGCSRDSAETVQLDSSNIEQKLASMTLEQKVAQLFIVDPEQLTGYHTVTAASETSRDALAERPVGGIVYYQKNLTGLDQTKEMLSNLQGYALEVEGMPLFLCVDEEGGMITRIAEQPGYPIGGTQTMAAIGATGDDAEAREVGEYIGAYLHDLGFTVNFAPVADVATNSSNPLAIRCFSDDPHIAASMVAAAVEGFLDTGVLCTLKHFPGTGSTAQNTDYEHVVCTKTLDELREVELKPFTAGIAAGAPLVMMSHMVMGGLGDTIPASLSKTAVTGLLREELGFTGVIVTDSLSVMPIRQVCSPDRVGVEALLAGCDLLLTPYDFELCYQGVLGALDAGELDETRIDASLRRILKAKAQLLA